MKSHLSLKPRILFFLIMAFSLAVRLYKISEIPGEWFGDISNVHEYTQAIMKGEWPFYFFQSPGPLYHYLITPLVILIPYKGYETYKLASIIVSILGIITAYLLVSVISKRLALITTCLMGFSFWYLSWSRIGNSQIVIPVISSLVGYFLLRYIKKRQFIDLLVGGCASILGLYTYPQTFIFPPLYFILIFLFTIFKRKKIRWSHILSLIIILIIGTIPFIKTIQSDSINFQNGYIGSKFMPLLKEDPLTVFSTFVKYYVKTLEMYHIAGDHTFRVNIPDSPHLDRISGILFLLGIGYFWQRKNKIFFLIIIIFLLIFPIPSVSPALSFIEIPNSGRTIAVVPYVYLLSAAGLLFFHQKLAKIISNSLLTTIVSCAIFVVVVLFNLTNYFIRYPNFLPEHNLSPGKTIAHYLDTSIPLETAIYFKDCCWGEQGEPEPKAVSYQLQNPRKIVDFKLVSSCSEIVESNAGLIFNPKKFEEIEKYIPCFDKNSEQIIKNSRGDIVAGIIFRKF